MSSRRAAADSASTSPDALVASGWAFDPDQTFADGGHRLPFAAELQDTMEPAIAAGAIGFIGVLRGYPSGGCEYYVPYDGRPRPIPGVYVSERTGDLLFDLLEDDAARANMEVVAERGSTATRNVVGELPGTDDEWVIIGTHHDAPWASAVEDGTGIAMVLAQAAAWAAVPESDRPHRLIFLATGAHMSAAAGTRAFIERHRQMLDRTVLEVHLEHAALDSPPEGQPLDAASTRVTPRWWFTTENPVLEQIVWDAIVAHHLDRSLVLTPDALGAFPTTDGGLVPPGGGPARQLPDRTLVPLRSRRHRGQGGPRLLAQGESGRLRHRASDGQDLRRADARPRAWRAGPGGGASGPTGRRHTERRRQGRGGPSTEGR